MDKSRHKTAIPNKLYFRIGEVSDIVGVKPYVLRYWESEFPDIKPTKSKSGQRLYKRRDVEILVRIKELLYEERFTINGARRRLKDAMGVKAHETEAETETEIEKVALPRQLDVFELDSGMAKSHPVEKVQTKETFKTLVKIRKDLESLLEVVKN